MLKLTKLICGNALKECSMVLWRETNQSREPVYCPACLSEGHNIRMLEEVEKGENIPKVYKFEKK